MLKRLWHKFFPPRSLENDTFAGGERQIPADQRFYEKLRNDDYEEALRIARKYGFDTNIIYQRQWNSSPVTEESIESCLPQIAKKDWVIRECLERIPDSLDVMEKLIRFGLKETEFAFETLLIEEWEANPRSPSLVFDRRQLEICRRKFHRYLSRLDVYRRILEIGENLTFCGEFYKKFRVQSVLEACINFARECKWRSIEVMFDSHGDEALQHWLVILSNFPETVKPYIYAELLPICRVDSDLVKPWSSQRNVERSRHSHDDSESESSSQDSGPQDDYDTEFEQEFYFKNPGLAEFRQMILTKTLVAKWFIRRSREIESISGLVGNSIQLLELGHERNVCGLEKLCDDFEIYTQYIYICCPLYNVKEIEFSEFECLTNDEKANFLMAGAFDTTGEHFIECLDKILTPFMVKVYQDKAERDEIFWSYLVRHCQQKIVIIQKIFQRWSDENSADQEKVNEIFAIDDDETLIELVIRCVKSVEIANKENLDAIFNIIGCLPETEAEIFHRKPSLKIKVDHLYKQFEVVELLDHYHCQLTLKRLDELVENANHDEIVKLFTRVCVNFVKKADLDSVKEIDWRRLLDDLQNMRQLCFVSIVMFNEVLEIFVATLLSSGRRENLTLASSFMILNENQTNQKLIDCKQSMKIILNASREYVNSASSVADDSITLAKECLNLLDKKIRQIDRQFIEESEFIEALNLLNSEFSVRCLPVQVRLMDTDRLEIILQALKGKTSAYKRHNQLLSLARLLHLMPNKSDTEREIAVLGLIGGHALEIGDFQFSYQMCQAIMQRELDQEKSNGWRLCLKLGGCSGFKNLEARLELLTYALTYCDVIDEISDILELAKSVKLSLLVSSSKETQPVVSKMLSTPIELTSKLVQVLMKEKSTIELPALNCINLLPLYQDAFGGGIEYTLNSVDYDYQRFSPSSKKEPLGMSSVQIKLRIGLLEKKRDERLVIENLENLAFCSFFYDSPLAVACLLSLDVEKISEPFEKLSNHSRWLSLIALFSYSALYCRFHRLDIRRFDFRRCGLSDVILKGESFIAAPIEKRPEMLRLEKLIEREKERLAKFDQEELTKSYGRRLAALDPSFDIAQFEIDTDYQQDTLLGLALTDDEKVFNTIVDLAEIYKVDRWQLYVTHLEYLLTTDSVALSLIKDKVLGQDESFQQVLKQRPPELKEYFRQRIFPLITSRGNSGSILCDQILEKICGHDEIEKIDKETKKIVKIDATSDTSEFFNSGEGEKSSEIRVLKKTIGDKKILNIEEKKPAEQIEDEIENFESKGELEIANETERLRRENLEKSREAGKKRREQLRLQKLEDDELEKKNQESFEAEEIEVREQEDETVSLIKIEEAEKKFEEEKAQQAEKLKQTEEIERLAKEERRKELERRREAEKKRREQIRAKKLEAEKARKVHEAEKAERLRVEEEEKLKAEKERLRAEEAERLRAEEAERLRAEEEERLRAEEAERFREIEKLRELAREAEQLEKAKEAERLKKEERRKELERRREAEKKRREHIKAKKLEEARKAQEAEVAEELRKAPEAERLERVEENELARNAEAEEERLRQVEVERLVLIEREESAKKAEEVEKIKEVERIKEVELMKKREERRKELEKRREAEKKRREQMRAKKFEEAKKVREVEEDQTEKRPENQLNLTEEVERLKEIEIANEMIRRFEEFEKIQEVEEAERLRKAEEAEKLARIQQAEDARRLKEIEETEELERLRQVEEVKRLRQIQEAEEAERLRQKEVERLKQIQETEEAERLRQEEVERLKQIQEAEEAETLRQEEVERLRQVSKAEEAELLRQSQEIERLRKIEEAEETERLRQAQQAEEVERLRQVQETERLMNLREVEESERLMEIQKAERLKKLNKIKKEVRQPEEAERLGQETERLKKVQEAEETRLRQVEEAEKFKTIQEAEQAESLKKIQEAEEAVRLLQAEEAEKLRQAVEAEKFLKAIEAERLKREESKETERLRIILQAEEVERVRDIHEAERFRQLEKMSEAKKVEQIRREEETKEAERMRQIEKAEEARRLEKFEEARIAETPRKVEKEDAEKLKEIERIKGNEILRIYGEEKPSRVEEAFKADKIDRLTESREPSEKAESESGRLSVDSEKSGIILLPETSLRRQQLKSKKDTRRSKRRMFEIEKLTDFNPEEHVNVKSRIEPQVKPVENAKVERIEIGNFELNENLQSDVFEREKLRILQKLSQFEPSSSSAYEPINLADFSDCDKTQLKVAASTLKSRFPSPLKPLAETVLKSRKPAEFDVHETISQGGLSAGNPTRRWTDVKSRSKQGLGATRMIASDSFSDISGSGRASATSSRSGSSIGWQEDLP